MINKLKKRLQKTVDYLKEQLKQIRTGRANTALVENLEVEVYNAKMAINQLATVSVPEPRTILIAPWDKGSIGPIEKALQKADLGAAPSVGDDTIRVVFPPMTEERRKELAVIISQEAENARISIRNVRKEFLQQLDKEAEEESLSEDEKKRLREQIDEEVKSMNKVVEDISGKKEEEIMKM